MRFLIALFLLASTAFAVDFVAAEVDTKFAELDASIATNVTNVSTNVTNIATNTTDLAGASADGNHVKRVARATWDFAADGGATSAIGLGVTIPAKALVNFAYWYTVTQVVDGGSGTGALSCEDANNLFTAADVTGNAAKVVVLGIPQNSAATMVKDIGAACELTWTIAGAAATAGKLIFFVEYTILE